MSWQCLLCHMLHVCWMNLREFAGRVVQIYSSFLELQLSLWSHQVLHIPQSFVWFVRKWWNRTVVELLFIGTVSRHIKLFWPASVLSKPNHVQSSEMDPCLATRSSAEAPAYFRQVEWCCVMVSAESPQDWILPADWLLRHAFVEWGLLCTSPLRLCAFRLFSLRQYKFSIRGNRTLLKQHLRYYRIQSIPPTSNHKHFFFYCYWAQVILIVPFDQALSLTAYIISLNRHGSFNKLVQMYLWSDSSLHSSKYRSVMHVIMCVKQLMSRLTVNV